MPSVRLAGNPRCASHCCFLAGKSSNNAASCRALPSATQEGELPSEMVPKHNDDPYSDDEEEQEQERAPKLSKVLLSAWS